MEPDRHILWSWHTPDFPMLEGEAESRRGEYWQSHPTTVRTLYPLLHQHLGTCQVIWCYTEPTPFFVRPGKRMTLWRFEVGGGDICFIDTQGWHELVQGHRPCRDLDISTVIVDPDEPVDKVAVITLAVARESFKNAVSVTGQGSKLCPLTLFDTTLRRGRRCRR